MTVFKQAKALRAHLEQQKSEGRSIGFVPTMGALHEGHISLLETSRNAGQYTVVSIFVNPTQFNDPKDFEKYPKTVENDMAMLEQHGCDVLFLPSVEEMYPGGTRSRHYELGAIEKVLEGEFRPGHFQGVCTVVDRLLEIVDPAKLFMGRKDYQQCMLIRKLLELTGRSGRTELVLCPTLREPDGLAMSSRNTRLNREEREKAVMISRSLQFIRANAGKQRLEEVRLGAESMLVAAGFKVDYVSIADAQTLEPLSEWREEGTVALIAAFIGGVRLIDNLEL